MITASVMKELNVQRRFSTRERNDKNGKENVLLKFSLLLLTDTLAPIT